MVGMRSHWRLALVVVAGCYSHPYEICDGKDNDHDPDTPDGFEEQELGEPCDGIDADECMEGSTVCVDGRLVCNDSTSDSVEVCDHQDNDCNGMVDEIFDLDTDVTNCGSCNTECTNANGLAECTAGQCTPTCEAGAVDCNGNKYDGCEVFRDRNPSCLEIAGTGDIVGDSSGNNVVMFTGTDEAIYQVTLREVSTADSTVRGTIELSMAGDLDVDLYVYCDSCDGAIMGSSRNAMGITETVPFAAPDISNINDDHTIWVEVRYVNQTTCGSKWTLKVTGNTASGGITCR